MRLKHCIFYALVFFGTNLYAQSFQAGLIVDLTNRGFDGIFIQNESSPIFSTTYQEITDFGAELVPGILFTYNFKNGNILEARVQGIFDNLAFASFNLPIETDADYQLISGLEFYKRINSIQSPKASFYFGGGLGYKRNRIAISGFNELDGYERYVNLNGILVSGGFRSNIQFSSWFALTASANLQFFEFEKETRFTRNASVDGGGSTSFDVRNFNLGLNPYFRVGILFTLFSKK